MKPARPSSAVILIREVRRKIEIFMGQRHERATFASAFVFPGGVISKDDHCVYLRCRGLREDDANQILSVKSGGLDYYSAAIRELFEETGVLLAVDSNNHWASDNVNSCPPLAETRISLRAGKLSWPKLLSNANLNLATNELHYLGHWETPVTLNARFSTRFFLAELPPGQKAQHDGEELVASRWLEPGQALSLHNTGDIELPFPQMKNLEILADFTTPEMLRNWAHNRWREPIERIRPWIQEEQGKRQVILPWEPNYPDNA
jgi:8-oxo-dGTP pyrophosphatase MutT (NUDIX family)